MRYKGYILLILLVMLLFASGVLLQFNEDNYLIHLVGRHVDTLSQDRQMLKQAFKTISNFSIKNPTCYTTVNTKNELEAFWNMQTGCKVIISGLKVNYAFQEFQEEMQEKSYLQYTLHVKTNATSSWLQAVIEQGSNKVVSWNAYF